MEPPFTVPSACHVLLALRVAATKVMAQRTMLINSHRPNGGTAPTALAPLFSVRSIQVIMIRNTVDPDGEAMPTAVRKKTYNLDEELIETVRRLFHVKTDTEPIHKALQKTVEEHREENSLAALLRAGRFRTIYR